MHAYPGHPAISYHRRTTCVPLASGHWLVVGLAFGNGPYVVAGLVYACIHTAYYMVWVRALLQREETLHVGLTIS
jgi:hypothetical protein